MFVESASGEHFAASTIDPAAADGKLIKPKRYDGGELFGAFSVSLTAHFSIVVIVVMSSLLKYCLPAAPPAKAIEKVDVKLVALEEVVPPAPVRVLEGSPREAGELGAIEGEVVAPKMVAIKAPSKKRSPSRARAAALRDAQEFGMIGLLRASESQNVLARLDGAPGGVEGAVVGGVVGGLIGESYGSGGLGLSGTGLGGGGTGEGIGSIGTLGRGGTGSGFGYGRGRTNPISSLLRARVADMQSCFRKAVEKDPKLQGRAVLSIRIAEDGSIASLTMRPKLDPELDACLEDVVRSIAFPKEAATVSFPIRFVVQ